MYGLAQQRNGPIQTETKQFITTNSISSNQIRKSESCRNFGFPHHSLYEFQKSLNVSKITSLKLANFNYKYPNKKNQLVVRVLY